jgi:2-C-methyl-D-erythritol 4-phosphate cytidylyltransferase / 2-C-methyl-D-erythritol 2,4-cyclodiphosphate synthase
MTTAAIIVSAGHGIRAGGVVPKQYQRVCGKALIAHAYDCFAAYGAIDHIIIIHGEGQEDLLHTALEGRTASATATGGAMRRDSVWAGLNVAESLGADRVLIHDAARPFIPGDVINRLLAALDAAPGAIPVLPVVDTLVRGDGRFESVVPRDCVHRVQTPQAFRLEALMAAHHGWGDAPATDDAQIAAAAGYAVSLVAGDVRLEKITLPEDFARMEASISQPMIGPPMISRTALGYDVHRLAGGEELWLGGVLIPHDKGLSGHSDADVALHAITDALLGTICAGDIGAHFPPSDARWKGARSAQFMAHAAQLIREKGGIIDFVDLTIICEAPKIGPHREAMRSEIANILNISAENISVKATTTEGLGFTGRGEGIAAQAAATVRIPVA